MKKKDLKKDCELKAAGTSCRHVERARPSMEACGIDVIQTAQNNRFHIETLRDNEV